jgi:hypothetical protein
MAAGPSASAPLPPVPESFAPRRSQERYTFSQYALANVLAQSSSASRLGRSRKHGPRRTAAENDTRECSECSRGSCPGPHPSPSSLPSCWPPLVASRASRPSKQTPRPRNAEPAGAEHHRPGVERYDSVRGPGSGDIRRGLLAVDVLPDGRFFGAGAGRVAFTNLGPRGCRGDACAPTPRVGRRLVRKPDHPSNIRAARDDTRVCGLASFPLKRSGVSRRAASSVRHRVQDVIDVRAHALRRVLLGVQRVVVVLDGVA